MRLAVAVTAALLLAVSPARGQDEYDEETPVRDDKEAKPVEGKPVEGKPVEGKPVEGKPVEGKAPAKTGELRPEDEAPKPEPDSPTPAPKSPTPKKQAAKPAAPAKPERPSPREGAPPEPPEAPEDVADTGLHVPLGTWIAGGVAVACGVAAGVTGGIALARHGRFDDINDGRDPQGAQDVKDSGQALSIATDVLIGSAVVAAGVGAVLFFTADRTVGRVQVTPVVASHGAAAVLSATF